MNTLQSTRNISKTTDFPQLPVRDAGEYERESEAVETNLNCLEERLRVLQNRLGPVLMLDRVDGEVSKASPGPSSQVGAQLRGYSDRIESVASQMNYLLDKLILP